MLEAIKRHSDFPDLQWDWSKLVLFKTYLRSVSYFLSPPSGSEIQQTSRLEP